KPPVPGARSARHLESGLNHFLIHFDMRQWSMRRSNFPAQAVIVGAGRLSPLPLLILSHDEAFAEWGQAIEVRSIAS
ncbi:MAG: hypothetical protein NZ741_11900, partial [Armatimonadetes bacterium]|nr:hypothetical protein [Armatimonadota bacterium]